MTLSDLTVSLLLAVLPICGVIFGLYSTYRKWLDSPLRNLAYPPGPPAAILLGNSMKLPFSQAWVTYADWAKEYGDIMYLNIYGQHTIILNSVDDAVELFERRSRHYSDRPKNTIIDLMGWDFNVTFMPYGEQWRFHRRLLQQCFRSKASVVYQPIQTAKVHDLLYDLLTAPAGFRAHCKKATTAIIMAILYGHDLTPETSNYFSGLAEKAVAKLEGSLVPGAIVANYIPVLRYLPAWFPGAAFKHLAAEVKVLTSQMQEVPMDFVGKGLLKGTATPSLVSDLLENCYVQREYDMIKRVAASSYASGADTTVSPLLTFFLAMALFPAAQKKAQDEIDKVLGLDRLPNFADRPALPCVEALYREVTRWKPVTPLNTAHMATDDDVYKGYYIPKGSTIIANTWAMTRNEEKYPNPETFDPDRFLDKEGRLNDDNMVLNFGFGRRICPGRHLASATIWLTIVSVLATFDIRKKKDINGREIPIEGKYTDELVSHPHPFECSITPRRGNTGKLVRDAVKTSI
ncbi:hypothetical protein GALMADRAFT_237960 [Galerina marginata CBS 339.88]|uniref:Cytochrome P450 n=1 Tax=Galerina marginata (strain CBS 339.88) TaxID=685588 RepID=A0A067TJR6_GALM3|nr:hypothetical protein GALMADRAFT_237960 [Galerina marginata CBS 339.88]